MTTRTPLSVTTSSPTASDAAAPHARRAVLLFPPRLPPPRRPPHERIGRRSTFSLFTPTSHNAIQESLASFSSVSPPNSIDSRRAGLLLYCLQIASANLRTAQKAAEGTADPRPSTNLNEESELEEGIGHAEDGQPVEGSVEFTQGT